jgi:hypothetical protein
MSVRTGSHGSAGRLGRRRLGVDAGIDDGSRGGDGTVRRRLGRQPERAEQAPHRMGLGHHAEDPPRAGTAGTDEDFDREHAVEEPAHGSHPGDRGASWPAGSLGAAGNTRSPESGRSVSYMYPDFQAGGFPVFRIARGPGHDAPPGDASPLAGG